MATSMAVVEVELAVGEVFQALLGLSCLFADLGLPLVEDSKAPLPMQSGFEAQTSSDDTRLEIHQVAVDSDLQLLLANSSSLPVDPTLRPLMATSMAVVEVELAVGEVFQALLGLSCLFADLGLPLVEDSKAPLPMQSGFEAQTSSDDTWLEIHQVAVDSDLQLLLANSSSLPVDPTLRPLMATSMAAVELELAVGEVFQALLGLSCLFADLGLPLVEDSKAPLPMQSGFEAQTSSDDTRLEIHQVAVDPALQLLLANSSSPEDSDFREILVLVYARWLQEHFLHQN
jgi:hypothetical protein